MRFGNYLKKLVGPIQENKGVLTVIFVEAFIRDLRHQRRTGEFSLYVQMIVSVLPVSFSV